MVSDVRSTLPTGSENSPSMAIEISVTEKTATSTMGTSAESAKTPVRRTASCEPADRARRAEMIRAT